MSTLASGMAAQPDALKARAPLPVLILTPKRVNYFYEVAGQRIADAMRLMGFDPAMSMLHDYDTTQMYEWCFILNIYDVSNVYVYDGYGTPDDLKRELERLREHCRRVCVVSMEPVGTEWHKYAADFFRWVNLDLFVDLGLASQREVFDHDIRERYRFVMNGLTPDEHATMRALEYPGHRAIPWTFVGLVSQQRLEVLDMLIHEFHPSGFVYALNEPTPIQPGGPHLDQAKFRRVQTYSQYVVWCSQHNYFYLETERFREAGLAGTIPIKILLNPIADDGNVYPFRYLMIDKQDAVRQMRQFDPEALWHRFINDYLNLPSLETSLRQLVETERPYR